ncbi:Lrp/AsnC family transcriptional regulator [Microbacterium sp. 18062]|uniref:Lrp/AsnC family transcriptional regulator n=1 Tax=Microbacterium sp. 18062 TaxID=2681410 RepID=UPI00135AA4D5|nr:Lrp/AsnC family transcriptional regulator [Microbacterium sp. 18062]
MTGPRHAFAIDATDRRIVEAIQTDGRMSLTALASAVHLGISATRVRLQALEQRGVVSGYTARVDASALGYPLRAIARLSVDGFQDARVFAILDEEPRIVRCSRITGEICFVFEIVAADMADLERITLRLAELGTMTTDLVYELLVERAVPTR